MIKKNIRNIFSVRNMNLHKVLTICGIKFKFKKIMKLGISYNLFNGEELLEASIKSVRKEAYHINVVYQKTSYFGNSASENLETFLIELKNKGLIDEIYFYDKVFQDSIQAEAEKRDIGLKIAKKNGCTHFLSMDVDEFYDAEEFKYAKEFILKNNIKSSAVSITEYLKTPEYKLLQSRSFDCEQIKLYNYYCPFIMKINKFSKQKHGKQYFPCLVDPTRSLNHNLKFYLFSIQDIVMHHMSTVRRNLDYKYENTNSNTAAPDILERIKNYRNKIKEWEFEKNQIGNSKYSLLDTLLVEKVDNKFNIHIS